MRIAIIGSGLGGLADLLAGHHQVTIFERGPNEPCRPQPALMTSHRFGLYPSFAYGLGGTTNYWHGGLVEMLADEMGTAWPDSLKSELPRYYAGVVRQLYGGGPLQGWQARKQADLVDGVLPTQLFYMHPPFRAAESSFLTMGRVRTGHRVERVEERAGGVDVVNRARPGNNRAFRSRGDCGRWPELSARPAKSGLGGREGATISPITRWDSWPSLEPQRRAMPFPSCGPKAPCTATPRPY